MRTEVAGGLGLMAAAAVCAIGVLLAPAPAEVVGGGGAWLAVAATATVYRDVSRQVHRVRAAVALALLGVVASAWTVGATLGVAGARWIATRPVPPPVMAAGAALGLALLAYTLGQAGLIRRRAAVIIAVAALLGPLTLDPGVPYLMGAGPLGAALLVRANGTRKWEGQIMRIVYRTMAYVIAAEVAVQATLIALGFAGLGHWIAAGNVFDKAVMESDQLPFPEVIGIILHGINGGFVIPVLALALLVVSFFARVAGGVKFAVVVLVLVAVQAELGYAGHDLPALGAVHGLNALLLFTAALHTGRRARRPAAVEAPAVTPVA